MKHLFLVSILLLLLGLTIPSDRIQSDPIKKDQEYITKHKYRAILEMKMFGIPASVTLAQALVESAAGTSELALNANNHFGIKCKEDWWGEYYIHSDDIKDECFRKYSTIGDSYRDHSVFLSQRKRYAGLFKLKLTDYKGWCMGLMIYGYATDPDYSTKLIEKIELHDLTRLDE